MPGATRGFLGRRRQSDARLPPGQYDVGADWPGLTAEPTPPIEPATWSMVVDSRVVSPPTWSRDYAHPAPESHFRRAMHYVNWRSKFDAWCSGVSVDTLLQA